VTRSLRTLLTGIIDYAGLFPPAKLPLTEALPAFTAGRGGPDALLLSRFVIPAARLGEVAPLAAHLSAEAPAPFSALARGGNDAEAVVAGLDRDLGDIEGFLERHGAAATVDALELRIPASVFESSGEEPLAELFERTLALVESRSPVPLEIFFEAGLGPDWHRSLSLVIAALGRPRAMAHKSVRRVGFKLRCGGTEPSAFPPVEQVARALAACRDERVPFKATAGLHHPLRHLDRELLAKSHGFLNVFGAAVLAHACGLDEPTIAEAVADEDPSAFAFDDERMRWREYDVPVASIAAAREELATSFGSCSFAEPRDDLKALGFW
jgi:hypothetical protein